MNSFIHWYCAWNHIHTKYSDIGKKNWFDRTWCLSVMRASGSYSKNNDVLLRIIRNGESNSNLTELHISNKVVLMFMSYCMFILFLMFFFSKMFSENCYKRLSANIDRFQSSANHKNNPITFFFVHQMKNWWKLIRTDIFRYPKVDCLCL